MSPEQRRREQLVEWFAGNAELRLIGIDITDPSAHARGVIATVEFSEAAIEIEMGRITAHWSRLQN